ncbi:MAG: HAMP domain-containing histidine kinase [Saprospiraceae bacterium]|nr:HAMP domain-containing histidine kinase [Saprospiraceae bacterium]
MKRKGTHRYAAPLIAFSLLLLALFLGFWLHRIWQEQFAILQKESDFHFQRSVMSLQDSLVRRSLVDSTGARIPGDGFHFPPVPPMAIREKNISLESGTRTIMSSRGIDKIIQKDSVKQDVKIFVATSTNDSIFPKNFEFSLPKSAIETQEILGPDEKNSSVHIRFFGNGASYTFNIETDSISLDELSDAYRTALNGAGLNVDFHLWETDTLFVPDGEMVTRPMSAGLINNRFYVARIDNVKQFVTKQMVPYALFSLLLFGVTAAAFAFIFRSLREQEKLARMKNEFISNITHELKTPITTVGVALEAMSDFNVLNNPAQTREYLEISRRELERLGLLVDKVLRLSLYEQQEMRLNLEKVDFPLLVTQVLASLKLQTEHLGATIRWTPPTDAFYNVQADRMHLVSVVFNLLDNALKYGGPKLIVFLNLQNDGDKVHLFVSDNGPGIPEVYRDKIFEKFFRVPSGNRHNVKGHGLGLHYVATVLHQMGGAIRLSNIPERPEGSTFQVTLPAATPPPSA